jgi:hypothetical protein
MMALAFLSMEKMAYQEQLPLISYRDIRYAIIENFVQKEKTFKKSFLNDILNDRRISIGIIKKPNLLK